MRNVGLLPIRFRRLTLNTFLFIGKMIVPTTWMLVWCLQSLYLMNKLTLLGLDIFTYC